jgi:hypothetical protein
MTDAGETCPLKYFNMIIKICPGREGRRRDKRLSGGLNMTEIH